LHVGTALYYASRKSELSENKQAPAVATVHTAIVADLLMQQAVDWEDVLAQTQVTPLLIIGLLKNYMIVLDNVEVIWTIITL
jgi:hypothetical protein